MSSQQRTTRNATQAAVITALRLPSGVPPEQQQFNRAVKEWIELRQGARGPFERAMTRRDTLDLFQEERVVTAPASMPPGGGVAVIGPDSSIRYTPMGSFVQSVLDNPLTQDMLRKIDDPRRFDAIPKQVRDMLLADLAAEARERGAAVVRLQRTIQDQSQSMAVVQSTLTASLKDVAAGVRQVSFASANANRATSGVVTQVTAGLAGMGGEDPMTATVEDIMLAVADRWDGLRAQRTIKVATNGAMAGIGLASTTDVEGNATSAVIIQTDKFALVASGDTLADPLAPPAGRIPFAVDLANDTIYLKGTVRIDTGTGTRLDELGKAIQLSAATDIFTVNSGGSASPSSITITATLLGGLAGTTSWSVTNGTATLTGSGTSRTLTYANLTTSQATITVSVTDTTNGLVYTKDFIVSKVTDGATGSTGARGSLVGYGSNYSISSGSWGDNEAQAVIYNMLNGTSLTTSSSTAHLRIGDTVTLSNGSSYTGTKYWGGTSWLAPGVVIDGNLLVSGTVTADRINVNGTTGINLISGSSVGKIKLDSSGNILLTSDVAGKAIGFNGSNSGSIQMYDSVVGTTGVSTLKFVSPITAAVSGTVSFQTDSPYAPGSELMVISSPSGLNLSASTISLNASSFSFAGGAALSLSTHNHSGVYADASHNHGASAITSGTLDIARIPTGTSGTTAALGDHNHSGVYLGASATAADSSKLGAVAANQFPYYAGFAAESPTANYTVSMTINGITARFLVAYP